MAATLKAVPNMGSDTQNNTTTTTQKKGRFSNIPWGGFMVGVGAGMFLWHIALKTTTKQQYAAAHLANAFLPPAGGMEGESMPQGNGNTFIVK